VAAFFLCYSTISAIYRIEEAGLNPFQLVLVGTVLELSTFLFEIPTGVVADVYSRRLSIVIGTFLIGVGFIVEGSNPTFAWILAAQVIWGVGFTFTSGAAQAWIVDELRGEGIGRVFLRAAQVRQLGALLGIGASVTLASFYLALPMIVGGALLIALALFLSVTMPERHFRARPPGERGSWRAMGRTFRGGVSTVRASPALLVILGAALFVGMSSEPLDRLWEMHFLTSFELPSLGRLKPVVWFGIINAAALVAGIGMTEVIRRRVNVDDARVAVRAVLWLNAALVVSVAVFALAGSFSLAMVAFLATRIARQADGPILSVWANQQIPSDVRATVLSMRTQSDSLGQVVGGPVLGAVATAWTVRAALSGTALLLLPAQALYARASRRR
jgi:DHA3 family tetracycline resistance protein-like MFS transporter